MADQRIESFLKSAPGKYFDPDGVFKYQCVDVILAFALHLWPGAGIRESVGWGNAKDYLDGRPVKYWKTVRNVWGSAALPPRGAVAVWGGPNTTYGHVALVLGATQAGVSGLQQNVAGGGNEPTTIGFLPWDLGGAGYFIGWLEPVLGPVVSTASTKPKEWLDMNEKELRKILDEYEDRIVSRILTKVGNKVWAYVNPAVTKYQAYSHLINGPKNVWKVKLKSLFKDKNYGKPYEAGDMIRTNNAIANGQRNLVPEVAQAVGSEVEEVLAESVVDVKVEILNGKDA